MTPERWQQVEELYHPAVERAPAERAAFLDAACAGDEALRREVESLLAFDERAESFIEMPPNDIAAGMIAEEQARSMVGRTLGHYRIHSLIGAGGMGEVYRARDTRLDRDVAVKILSEHLAGDAEALRRFEREAKVVAALSHPNILSIFDFGAEESLSYAVTELLEGETLRARLARGPLTWRAAAGIGVAIAEGLAATHAKRIIHRDLKPENIFLTQDGLTQDGLTQDGLTQDGRVKILDFGVARMKRTVSAEAETAVSTVAKTTQPGMVIGTPGYMSPEQTRGEEAEAPSDIFSLGCVMHEMLSGQRLFVRDTAAETIAAILKEEPPSLRQNQQEIPAELERIINKALRKDRADRYQTAGELLAELKSLKLGSEFGAETKRNEAAATTLSSRARMKRAVGVAIGAAIFSLGGVAAHRIWMQNPAPRAEQQRGIEVMRYYLEVESANNAPARATGFEPLSAESGFRFHFIPRQSGYLYIIAAGENNAPTAFLTARPIEAMGVATNFAEAGTDFRFPSGAGNGFGLGVYGTTTLFTIIFSPTPMTKPGFLSARANRQLTTDEQRELESLWQQFGKQPPELVPQTDGNQPSAAVTFAAEPPSDDPIIFDIPIKRR